MCPQPPQRTVKYKKHKDREDRNCPYGWLRSFFVSGIRDGRRKQMNAKQREGHGQGQAAKGGGTFGCYRRQASQSAHTGAAEPPPYISAPFGLGAISSSNPFRAIPPVPVRRPSRIQHGGAVRKTVHATQFTMLRYPDTRDKLSRNSQSMLVRPRAFFRIACLQ